MSLCYVPTLDVAEFLDSDWFDDWERYLNDWQTNELRIASLQSDLVASSAAISDNARLLAELNRQNSSLDLEIGRTQRLIPLSQVHQYIAVAGEI
jgi:hypothetical protein